MVATDLGKTNYADRARALMGIAQNLRDIGAQVLFDIPRVAVIGGQSAGKSSLVEAVSGIRVPRDGGTCTRCPMEVNLIQTDKPWSCSIILRFEYDSLGVPLSQVLTVPFGNPLTNVDEVELALRRAQASVLNYPAEEVDNFLAKSRAELEYYRSPEAFVNGTLKFSKNVVVVNIYDKGCANLSFVDLPGLIQNDEQETVQLVEDLVKSNIQGHCLILVTIPMSDDMENQRAMRIALEADKDKARTIGVLTKPDTLTSGAISARNSWRDLLTDKNRSYKYALKLGYYCVKLPDDAERAGNPNRAERNESESIFFSTTMPWGAVANRKHFGVSNLVEDLSRQLTMILDDILPHIRKQAQKQLDESRAALQQLPAPLVTDTSSEVLDRITKFCQEFSGMVYGNSSMTSGTGYPMKKFIQSNRKIYKDFKYKIRCTAPDFRPFEDYNAYIKPCFNDPETKTFTSTEGVGNGPRDLTYVRGIIQGSISWELPNNVPFDAKHALIDEFTKQWDNPTSQCFEEVYQNLTSCLHLTLCRHFDRFQKLSTYIGSLVNDLVEDRKQNARIFVDIILKQEKHPLFTQNEHYFSSLRLQWLQDYTRARKTQASYTKTGSTYNSDILDLPEDVSPSFLSDHKSMVDRALKALRTAGYPNVTSADLPRLLSEAPDAFGEELGVMADVRAYFFVAYKRIIDNVPLTIEHALNQALAESMQKNLLQRLNLGAADTTRRLKDLMEEDSGITRKRDELTGKISKLEKIEAALRILLA